MSRQRNEIFKRDNTEKSSIFRNNKEYSHGDGNNFSPFKEPSIINTIRDVLKIYGKGFIPKNKDLKKPADLKVDVCIEPDADGRLVANVISEISLSLFKFYLNYDPREGKWPGWALGLLHRRLVLGTGWTTEKILNGFNILETQRQVLLCGGKIQPSTPSILLASCMKIPKGSTAIGFGWGKKVESAKSFNYFLWHLHLKKWGFLGIKLPCIVSGFFSNLYKNICLLLTVRKFKFILLQENYVGLLNCWRRFKDKNKGFKVLNMVDNLDIFASLRRNKVDTPTSQVALCIGFIITIKCEQVRIIMSVFWNFQKEKPGFSLALSLANNSQSPIKNQSITKQLGSRLRQRYRQIF